eukprot:m51a1_g5658 hypothetical protein (838) ;mRNA; r:891490-894178
MKPLRSITELFWQLRLLTWKNLLLCWHGKQQTALQLLSPFFFILLLFACSYIVMMHDELNPQPRAEPLIPRCWPGSEPCTTLAWAIDSHAADRYLNDSQIYAAMADVLARNPHLSSKDVAVYNSSAAMYAYIKENPNRTQVAVVFYPLQDPVSPDVVINASLARVPYTIVVNGTMPETELSNDVYESVAYQVEQALLVQIVGPTAAATAPEFTNSRYPTVFKMKKFDAMTYVGPTMLYNTTMFNFMLLLFQIVQEKELKLRRQMKAVGMSDIAYWASYILFNVAFVFLTSLITILFGAIFQFAFFIKANFWAVFLDFFLFGLAMTPFSVLLSMLIQTTRSAVNAGMGVFLFGIMVQIIAANPAVLQQFYSPSFPSAIVGIFQLWPPFNFAKLTVDIASKSSQAELHTKGATFFTWSDMTQETNINGNDWVYPAPIRSVYWQLIDFAIFFGVAMFLYNVLPSEGGWFISFVHRRSAASNVNKKIKDIELDDHIDDDVKAEAEVASGERSQAAVKIKHFSKSYSTSTFSDKKVHAVKDISMTIQDNEILALLGHNGCGKSTTMNALSCILMPSCGDATIFGHSIVNDPSEVRRLIGVCPQDDVLWPDLTAIEHLKIFGGLKHLSGKALEGEIIARLGDVGLLDVGHRAAGTYSGGMKRRLSVAVSCVGNPKFLLLDEPTTGLDPVARRQMWASLQRLKEGRAVLLTTHSMEEAEALGDRIAIMRKAKIRCIGVPLHLKAKYGVGYVLNAVAVEGREQECTEFIREKLPQASVITHVNGNFKYGVPADSIHILSDFLLGVEQGPSSPIKEFGVSQTTIEEVFLQVCHNELPATTPSPPAS